MGRKNMYLVDKAKRECLNNSNKLNNNMKNPNKLTHKIIICFPYLL